MYILACQRLADLGGVHFFTLNSCKFSKGPARRVLHCVQRPLMSQRRRNYVIDQDFYLPCSLEDKLPLSLESVVVCCQSSSSLCYCRLFLLVFCAILWFFGKKYIYLFCFCLWLSCPINTATVFALSWDVTYWYMYEFLRCQSLLWFSVVCTCLNLNWKWTSHLVETRTSQVECVLNVCWTIIITFHCTRSIKRHFRKIS